MTLDEGTPLRRRTRLRLHWLGWALSALIVAVFLLLNRDEWRAMGQAARTASVPYLVLAGVLEAGWLVCFGAAFWAGLWAVGVRLPFGRTLPLSWTANFVNMVVKSGGMGGMAVFLRAAGRLGQSGSRTTLGYLLAIVLSYAGFLLVLALALALLWRSENLRRVELVAAATTFAFLLTMITGLVVVARSPRRVGWTYGRLAAAANRLARVLRRGPWIDVAGGERVAADVDRAMTLIREHPIRIVPCLGAKLGKEALGVAVLYSVLHAFGIDASVTLALTAYAVSILFSYVSIVPSGVGLVEVSLAALLVRSGAPPAPAALAAIVYRLFSFWMPFFVGAVATRFTRVASGE